MAHEGGSQATSLIARLAESPFGFDFFAAVRRLECARADLPRVGASRRPQEDPVRFCQEPSLAFPPSTISKAQIREGLPPLVFVSFLGLLGPNGPMPLYLTELARERLLPPFRDATLSRFLDLFNHRMVSFFYRAWAVGHQAACHDRGEDPFFRYVGSLFGMGMDSLRGRDAVPDVAKLHYCGRLVCKTRPAEGLAAILGDYFGLKVEIREFVCQWIALPEDCRCRLGESRSTGEVGLSVVVGGTFRDCQQKFRIRLGPLTMVDYRRMLPGGDSLARLAAWVLNYLDGELMYEVQLVIQAEEILPIRLGGQGQLGWTTWLYSRSAKRQDRGDLVLSPAA